MWRIDSSVGGGNLFRWHWDQAAQEDVGGREGGEGQSDEVPFWKIPRVPLLHQRVDYVRSC
ncbi:hypothetical protein E2C01_060855 [Portunus trituberculatus]|uniref:Uncharacterized protein n=1 Tax=Portunus trituberculatus TaxID=210409 RepID=A0A5B7H987_PORTR|nr:hypothetical protein [Portunus trituberculatus]